MLRVVLLLCLGLAPLAQAQQPTDPLIDELAGIRSELGAIVELLGALERHEATNALMARLRLKEARVSAAEASLKSAQDEVDQIGQEVAQLTMMEESFFEESNDRQLTDPERRQLEMLLNQRQAMSERAEALRPRIVELENELARAQNDLKALEEAVDERLGLR